MPPTVHKKHETWVQASTGTTIKLEVSTGWEIHVHTLCTCTCAYITYWSLCMLNGLLFPVYKCTCCTCTCIYVYICIYLLRFFHGTWLRRFPRAFHLHGQFYITYRSMSVCDACTCTRTCMYIHYVCTYIVCSLESYGSLKERWGAGVETHFQEISWNLRPVVNGT